MKYGIVFVVIVLCFACKQSDVFGDIEPNTSRVVVEFTEAKTGTSVVQDATPNTVEFDLTELRIDPRSVLEGLTKVRVIINPVIVTEYNSENGTSYTPVPLAAFSLTSTEFKFDTDKRKQMVRAAMRPTALLNGSYAVGLSISEVSGGEIASNAKNIIVFLSVKNKYDGIYSIRGYSNIPGTSYIGPFTVPCDEELEVITSNVSSVVISPTQPVANGNSFVYIGNLLPEISFDAANKVSDVKAVAGGIDLLFPYDPAYNSRYDPSTKTIYVKYGVGPVGSGRFIIDTLTYCGPR